MEDPRIEGLARALAARPPRHAEVPPGVPTAAVALVLRPGTEGPELLLIRRAERAGDPWSGHMALPGGRTAPSDAGPAATAARETWEEVGIDLGAGRLVGALDVLAPMAERAPRIVVSPFVFAVAAGTVASTSVEVALALWVPLEELSRPGCATEYLHEMGDGTVLRFPAYGARGHIVWGMTHRILTGFLELYAGVEDAHDLHDVGR